MIHIIPVICLQLLRGEGNPGHFVSVVVRRVEAVTVVNVERWVRMSEKKIMFYILGFRCCPLFLDYCRKVSSCVIRQTLFHSHVQSSGRWLRRISAGLTGWHNAELEPYRDSINFHFLPRIIFFCFFSLKTWGIDPGQIVNNNNNDSLLSLYLLAIGRLLLDIGFPIAS